jgi:cell wall-associated NlpC family hydrolase
VARANRIAREALEWVDTPFVWGQSVKGVGCDCKGLIQGVFRELGRPEAESFYATFSSYRADRPVPSGLLVEGFSSLFNRVQEMKAGDILLLNYMGRPAHMAIYVGDGRAVHGYHGRNGSGVRNRPVEVLLHNFPLHSVWRCR